MTSQPTYGPYDPSTPPPVDFDQWMNVSADLLDRTPDEVDRILARRRLDPSLWEAVNIFWLEELNRQVSRLNFKLASRFGMRCRDELAHRAKARERPSAEEMDDTAMMTALPDDTVIPFDSPLAGLADAAPPAAGSGSGEHPNVGETLEVPVYKVPEGTLPFDD